MQQRNGTVDISRFADHFVVYRSQEDEGLFVAHSVRTDQVGVADSVVEAVHEMYCSLHALLEDARKDKNLQIDQLAPDPVVKLFLAAEWLPDEDWGKIRSKVALHKAVVDDDDWELDLDAVEDVPADIGLADGSDSFWRDVIPADLELQES